MALEYWLKGDVPPGPLKATVVHDVKRVADILSQFKGSSALLVGPNVKVIERLTGDSTIERLVKLSKAIQAPVVTSDAEIARRLSSMGFTNYAIEFPLDVVRRLSRGLLDYRLVAIIGLRYHYAWLLLNNLKHYRPDVSTLSLDPYAQPNATWTLPSLPLQVWLKSLSQIIDILNSSKAQSLV